VKKLPSLISHFILLPNVSHKIQSAFSSLSLKNKIIGGYALALSIAVGGTTVGLVVGNYYQLKASTSRDAANRQNQLLSDLQVAMLETLPTREFVPILKNPREFELHTLQLPVREQKIKKLISELKSSPYTINNKNLISLLSKNNQIVETFYRQLTIMLNSVNLLRSQPESSVVTKKLITDFTGGREFGSLVSSAYELTAFIKDAQKQEHQAQIALVEAESLRNQIIVCSMMLSVLFAAKLSFSTSRAIARPIEAVTQVAQLVSNSSDFSLQVPVTTSDEIGLLSRSFNHLIQTIAIYVQKLERAELALQQKSLDLQQALTDLQNAQLQIVQSEKMSALGNLVAGVAHEMNNPLGFITTSLKQAKPTLADIVEHLKLYEQSFPTPGDEILTHAEEIDLEYSLEDWPKMIDSMTIACDRLKNISTSLCTFSRADQAYKVFFNIHEGIDSTILILKHRLKGNDSRPAIEVNYEYGNLPKIECFPGQLNQVFMNILANAIDVLDESNTGRSFEEIKANPNRITIITSKKENLVEVKIADNGKGMSESVKHKVFDHLFTTKPVGQGTGLGLAIARSIVVEKHTGTIDVNSTLGEGTEFVISLPILADIPG